MAQPETPGPKVVAVRHEITEDSDRAWFRCPGCGSYHAPHVSGDPNRHPVWRWNQNRVTPSFYPSIRVTLGEGQVCHFHVQDGRMQLLSDSSHPLAWKTVPMVPLDAEDAWLNE